MARKWIAVGAAAVVVLAGGWLVYAWGWLLGAPLPQHGVIITAPMDAHLSFEEGAFQVSSGSARLIDYGPWWAAALGVPFAILVGLALVGCRHLAGARDGGASWQDPANP